MGASREHAARPAHRPGGHGGRRQAWPMNDRVWTFGANFYLNPHVVFKADYQSFDVNSDLTRDLGMGLNF